MQKKPRFNPVVTRIKLNPEQAVLACGCYTGQYAGTGGRTNTTVCVQNSRTTKSSCRNTPSSSVS